MRSALRPRVFCLAALLASTLACAQAAAAEAEWRYRVQPGDTLLTLSDALLAPEHGWRDLQRRNRVADPLKLRPGSQLMVPLSWLRREAAVARVVHVQGLPQLVRIGSGAAQALAVGTELRAGDTLDTGPQASLSLRFADGSRLLISPATRLRLEELLVLGRSAIPSARLQLEQGNIENRVQPDPAKPPRYEIRSPALNLGVRGTEFRVQADAAGSRVQVLSGRVAALQGKGELSIPAGYGTLASPGQPALKPQPLPPAPDLSGQPARHERLPLRLAWRADSGATAWRAQVFAADSDEQLAAERVLATPALELADLPDGRYRLRLRSLSAQGQEGLSAEAGFVLKARPEPPFLQAPAADAALYGEQVRLAWTRALAAQHYRLQLADEAGFAAPLRLDREALNATELSLDLPPGRYYWRLASVRRLADGSPDAGPFSDAQSFTLRPMPPSPPLQPPELGDAQLRLRWRAVPGMRYELQLAADADFARVLKDWRGEAPQAELDRPGPGSYYLRVRSVDAHGQAGPWGGTQQIDVPQPRWLWLLPLLPLLLSL